MFSRSTIYFFACIALVGIMVSCNPTSARPVRNSVGQSRDREQRRRMSASEMQARADADDDSSNNDGDDSDSNTDDTSDIDITPKKSAATLNRRTDEAGQESQYEPSSMSDSSDENTNIGQGNSNNNKDNDEEINGDPEFDNEGGESSSASDRSNIDDDSDSSSNDGSSSDDVNVAGSKAKSVELAGIVDVGSENRINNQPSYPRRQSAYNKAQLEANDLNAAASHGHHHGHHGSGGMLIMGAHTSKKGAFGWHAKYPAGKGK